MSFTALLLTAKFATNSKQMLETTSLQKKIEAVITEIRNDAITPLIIGTILSEILTLIRSGDLTDWQPQVQKSLETLSSAIASEATLRASDDNEQRAAIALLRHALDESEDGTFAQSVREDIRDIFSHLTFLRDDQTLTDHEINRINDVIDSILGENASDAIENFHEILSFLDGVKDTDSLVGLLDRIRQSINANSNRLSELYPFSAVRCPESEVGVIMDGTSRLGSVRYYQTTDTYSNVVIVTTVDDNTFIQYRFSEKGIDYRRGRWDADDNVRYNTEWLPLTELFESLTSTLILKADRSELSNVLADPTSFEDDDEFESVSGFQREDLKLDLLIDLWTEAFKIGANVYGKYDPNNAPDPEHPFRAYDLWLTYEEAIAVILAGRPYNSDDTAKFYSRKNIRTNLPFLTSPFSGFGEFAFVNDTVEVFRLSDGDNTITGLYAFYYCRKLHTIINRIKAETGYVFGDCPKLVSVQVAIKSGLIFYLDACPSLSLESFRYMVDNSESCSLIVHPDVYAKLTDEANTQWHQILLDAAEKNINFATV